MRQYLHLCQLEIFLAVVPVLAVMCTVAELQIRGGIEDNSKIIFMPPTSEKLRGHIGLGLSVRPSVRLSIRPSVRLSVTCWQLRNSRTAYAGILKLYMWHVHEK